MAHESLYQTVGGASFPVTAAQITDGLQGLDAIRDDLLEFFRVAINAELGGGWAQAVTNSGASLASTPVGMAVPAAPTGELLQQEKVTFPALFLARDLADQRNRFEPYSLWIDKQIQIWGLTYMLPPLSAIGRRKLEDVLGRVVQVCHLAIKNMHHPAYESGAYWMQGAGINGLRLVNVRAGEARFDDQQGPTYPLVTLTLETAEITGHVEGTAAPLEHIALSVGTGNSDGIIPVLVEGTSEVPLQLNQS